MVISLMLLFPFRADQIDALSRLSQSSIMRVAVSHKGGTSPTPFEETGTNSPCNDLDMVRIGNGTNIALWWRYLILRYRLLVIIFT